jgi:hypothetical protein
MPYCNTWPQPILFKTFQTRVLFVLSARPRMCFIVYLGKMLKIKVGVYLGRADSGVTH